MLHARNRLAGASLTALLLGLSGCETTEPPPSEPLYEDLGGSLSSVSGYAFDPEAYLWAFLNCPEPCEIPPSVVGQFPLVSYATVSGATVAAYDPTSQKALDITASSGGSEAGWILPSVPARTDAPYYVQASGGTGVSQAPEGFPMPPAPAAQYVPTVNLRPIFTGTRTRCARQEAALLSRTGILNAVARTIPQTQVDDFLNPEKFGGVAFLWLTAPDPVIEGFPIPGTRIPAMGATISASLGTVTNVVWKAPGTGGALQSQRGFVVDASEPNLGLVVLRLPPGDAGKPVTVTGVYADPEAYPPMNRELVLQPGVINYAVLQLNPEGPSWESAISFYCEEG